MQFARTKLRPLSERFAWKNHFGGGVKAANERIALVRTSMANWP